MSRRRLVIGLVFLLAAGLGVGAWYVKERLWKRPAGPPDGPDQRPGKLVVLVVFDQMRGDYLSRWADQFGPDGFQRMKRDGVWYSDCHLPYACSSTGPGHASIATGAPPSVHGIVENEWYDRAAAARVYCTQPTRPFDRVPPLPGKSVQTGRGAETGLSPEHLLSETVADRLQVATGGKGRVVSVSIKDRTAVMMGGKKPTPDARDPVVYCFDTRTGAFHTGAYYADTVRPWVVEFNAGGFVNRWAGQEWTRLRPDLDYDRLAGRDDAPGEDFGVVERDAGGALVFGQKRVFPHPFRPSPNDPKKRQTYYTTVETSPAGNDLLFEFAKAAVAGEKLGTGEAADLLCVSFSSNDLIGHRWGPDSWELLDVTLRSDRLVADLLKFLDESVGAGRYAVVVTADHGVCPLPEQKRIPGAARKSINDILPDLSGAMDETFGKTPAGLTKWLEVVGKDADAVWPWVFLNHKAIAARGLDPAAVADYAAQWVGNRPFMMTAFTRKHIETNTLPPHAAGREAELRAVFDKVKLAFHPDRCGDVIAVPRPGVLVTGYDAGTSHGTPHDYDTHVPVLVYGAGVPQLGKRDGRVSSLIVAPTLAWALGIDPPANAKEKVPGEIAGGK